MTAKTFTHKDIADLLGVSETTVKSYRRKFPGCFPVASNGKPIRFTESASVVALRIRDFFEQGMSVEEVALRLSAEFSWFTPEGPKAGKGAAASSPELAAGVSNMAKSMVSMAQQQKAILARMQGIEAVLESLGLKDGDLDLAAAQKKSGARTERIEERLAGLDSATKELSETVAGLAGRLEDFLGRRNKAADEWKKNGGLSAADAEALREAAAPKQEGASIIPLRRDPKDETPPAQTAAQAAPGPAEPDRRFLTLPLVVRTGQNQYVSAGGQRRGRFCLNDLKAMLVYGFTPPNHFTLSFEPHGQAWWLTLHQNTPETPRSYQILLMELTAQNGASVVEILKLAHNGQTLHPAEFCSAVDTFSGA